MTVKMQKGGGKPIEVADESVEAFQASGFELCDGETAPEPAPDDTGTSELTEAEKQAEIDAAGKVARDNAEAQGMDADAVEAAGAEAEAAATAEVSGDDTTAEETG